MYSEGRPCISRVMNLFQRSLRRENNTGIPPIWFMRQAGRYHSHYQNLRKSYSFLDLCRMPKVSAEAAMGPINDFDFDAAILFSDILFPIEAMGVTLDFNPAPHFGRLLGLAEDLPHYRPVADPKGFFGFQGEALRELRRQLPAEKGLIGFIGGPLTLYQFACEGSGKVPAVLDNRFEGFMEKLIPLLIENMAVQAEAGIDCLAILDSSANIIPSTQYKTRYLPYLAMLINGFHARFPELPLLYYSKETAQEIGGLLEPLPLQALGIDHHKPLAATLQQYQDRFAIQGNFPPEWMNLPWQEAEPLLRHSFKEIAALSLEARRGWICGLGHGIQPTGREECVRNFIALAREIFA